VNFKASKSRKFGDSVSVTKWISFSIDGAMHDFGSYEDWLKGGIKMTVNK